MKADILRVLHEEVAKLSAAIEKEVAAKHYDVASGLASERLGLNRAIALVQHHGGPRDKVERFAELMEYELKHNDHKRGWSACSPAWLLRRLRQETAELGRSLAKYQKAHKKDGFAAHVHGKGSQFVQLARADAVAEASDVSNFAMMIADVIGGLK